MAQASYTPPEPKNFGSNAIVGHQFCCPYVIDLAITRKVLTISDGNFVVTDTNGDVTFKVKRKHFSLHDKRLLIDGFGNPILTLREKVMTAHDRWLVFRGDSTEQSDLLFSVKRSSLIQFKTTLDVFLTSNTKEDVCDFKVQGSWLERSCTVFAGESSTVLAQMHKKHTVESILVGKDKFTVTIYPNVDYAFVVALIVILEAINSEGDDD